jgi:hypothetical protein
MGGEPTTWRRDIRELCDRELEQVAAGKGGKGGKGGQQDEGDGGQQSPPPRATAHLEPTDSALLPLTRG